MTTKNTVQIAVYSDIACPWCFIGMRRLQSVIDDWSDDVEFQVEHHAYMLNPDLPAGGIDSHAEISRKYGISDLRPMFARVEAAARDTGMDLDLFRQKRGYSTVGAHTLLRHAAARGTQGALADALFVAYFMDALDVSDRAVLTELATRHGFSADEVARILGDEGELSITRDEARQASAGGITGVPFFIIDERYSISGAQPAEIFREAITLSLQAAGSDGTASAAR